MTSSYEEIVKGMRETAVSFDGALTKVKKVNQELVEKADLALKALTELLGKMRASSPTRKCTVCYTRDQATVCIPCGHVFCNSCADRAVRTRCHTCRARVDESMRCFIT